MITRDEMKAKLKLLNVLEHMTPEKKKKGTIKMNAIDTLLDIVEEGWRQRWHRVVQNDHLPVGCGAQTAFVGGHSSEANFVARGDGGKAQAWPLGLRLAHD